MEELDAKDRHILRMLSDNSRDSLTSMAKELGISIDAVAYRIKKMQDNGTILGFTARASPENAGLAFSCIILLGLGGMPVERAKLLSAYLRHHKNVWLFSETSGSHDAVVGASVRSQPEFRKLLLEIKENFPEIARLETLVELGGRTQRMLPKCAFQE